MRFGDMNFIKEPVGNFYGNLNLPAIDEATGFFDILFSQARSLQSELLESPRDARRHISAVSSRDIKLNHLYAVVQRRKTHKAQLDLTFEVTKRMRVDHVFEAFNIASAANQHDSTPVVRNFDCLKALIGTFEDACERLDDYSLQYVKYFVMACESGLATDSLTHVVRNACTH